MEKKLSIELLKNERLRQIQEEGYSWMHDDQLTAHQLSDAAIVYATPEPLRHEIIHNLSHTKEMLFTIDIRKVLNFYKKMSIYNM